MNIAVILAGGVGSRMCSTGIPKQFLTVFGRPIVIHTLLEFEKSKKISKIVVVCKAEYLEKMQMLVKEYGINKVGKIVSGGNTGQESIWKGLVAAEEYASQQSIVVIHDGVRPFITEALIDECIEQSILFGNAVAATPAIETVGISEKGISVDKIESRRKCFIIKAPQCFRFWEIYEAHKQARLLNKFDYVDSASLMRELCGSDLHIVKCQKSNIKVTTPEDFYVLRALFELKETIDVFGQ